MSTEDYYGQGVSIASLTDAPDAESLAKNIANAIVSRSVMRFTSASDRTATLTGLAAPVKGMVSYQADTDRLYRYDGAVWRPVAPVFQQGVASVSFASQNSFTMMVTFPTSFTSVPVVTTNIGSGDGSTARWGSRAISVTASNFTLFVYRGDGDDPVQTWSGVPVQWIAAAS